MSESLVSWRSIILIIRREWILTYQQDISQYPMADPPRAVPLQSSQPWQRIMESTLQWDKA